MIPKISIDDSDTKDQIPLFTTDEIPPIKLLKKMLYKMTQVRVMDKILLETQRQGRISFYITSTGEEATQIGSAAALMEGDHIFSQYREVGVLLWREGRLGQVIDQCFCNVDDPNGGRQMPIHYQSKKDNFHSISSPLANQMPHAVGAAYRIKETGNNVVICYFGEGAGSEGDAHAAFNMASLTESPVIFFCRNNQYSISTPTNEQYRGDGIASRGVGYGMVTFRVDGNDVYAVYLTVKKAREIALREVRPVLVEAITYRVGDHSTSDSSSSYRTGEEVLGWKANDPIKRLLLKANFEWKGEEVEREIRGEVISCIKESESKKKSSIDGMFTDVYKDVPWNLREQERELKDLLAKYPDEFELGKFSSN